MQTTETTAAARGPERAPWGELALTFVVLLVFSWAGIALASKSGGVATIWLTNGMLFGLVITRSRRWWWYFFAVGLAADTLADVLYGDPLRLAIGVSVANSIEVVTSVYLLTYWFGDPFNLSRRRPLFGFLGVAVIGATAVTSALGASWTLLFVEAGPWWKLFRAWYLGDILGMAILAPLVFLLLRPGFFEVLQPGRLGNTFALLLVPAGATTLVFLHDQDPLIFFIFPALLLVVFRLGFPGAALSVVVIAALSISLTVAGRGPLMLIRDANILHRIVVVQVFLAVSLFTVFPVAALLEDRRALELSLQKSEARYRALANVDGLTGLANRRWFDQYLPEQWRAAAENAQPVALLLADIDLFKAYNDQFGHIGGDDCLRQIARTLASAAAEEGATVARIGGEEFAVVLSNRTIDEAMQMGERMRLSVEEMRMSHGGSPVGVQTISIGVAVQVPDTANSELDLFSGADSALYCAKRLGRNRVEANDSRASFLSGTLFKG